MIESERRRVILAAVEARVATLAELVELTGASLATVRRDVAALDRAGRLRRVRGGAESLAPSPVGSLAGRPWTVNAAENAPQKRAIARAAAAMCADGEAIIVNGGTTTFQMVHPLEGRRLMVLTNSFPIAAHLLARSRNTVMMPGGTIYREQQIVLSPFADDVTRHFLARRMFMGAHGIGPFGITETDPLLIQAEERLLGQAEELVVLVDASKFGRSGGLLVRPLDRVGTVVTDDRVEDRHAGALEAAGVRLVVAGGEGEHG